MGKLEVNKKKKKDALFNTAFDLFTTKGLTKTTISDIVNQAGVAKGTFYISKTSMISVINLYLTRHVSCFSMHTKLCRMLISPNLTSRYISLLIIFSLNSIRTGRSFCLFPKISHGAYSKVPLKRKCLMTNITFISPIWTCWLRTGFITRTLNCFFLRSLSW